MLLRFAQITAHVNMLQVGSCNMQNFDRLKALGQASQPILIKRGLAAIIEEFVMAAIYIISHGNPDVVLCERGIPSFDNYMRNVLNLGAPHKGEVKSQKSKVKSIKPPRYGWKKHFLSKSP